MAENRTFTDEVLLGLIKSNSGGGGGGGTTNYNQLENKPQIGGVTLTGNKTASDLGLATQTDLAQKASIQDLADKQDKLTAGNNIKMENNAISVNRWFIPAGKVVYTIITSDENYGQNVHVQRHTIDGGFIDDRTFTCVSYQTVNIDDLISIWNPYDYFKITLLEDSDEQQAGYNYTVRPISAETSNSFTFVMPQEENDNDLIIRSELIGKVDKVQGKGLSTNDYTDADKAIVGGVTAALAGKVDKVEGKGLSTNDFTDAYKTAIGDNTTAISGIKNGASINSFGGVETALADKADKSAVKNEFIGTTAEWNALTTAQKKAYDTYQITDDYTEGSGSLPDYSTTEQLTGQKWIDGKDIYFKTYTNLQLTNSTPVVVDANFGSTNTAIDMRVILDGTTSSQSRNQCIASAYNEGGSYSVFPQVDGDNLQIVVRGNWTNYTASLVIYYTKTA